MKAKPILFSGPMVQAILENRKTQTRRIIKPQPDFDSAWKNLVDHGGKIAKAFLKEARPAQEIPNIVVTGNYLGVSSPDGFGTGVCCPNISIPYHVDDILWVRETIRQYYLEDETGNLDQDNLITEYRADNPDRVMLRDGDGFQVFDKHGFEKEIPWKPSIFMPKAACRIFLKVVSCRVERLQDISDADADAEGIEFTEIEDNVSGNFRSYQNWLPGKDFITDCEYKWNFGKEIHTAAVASYCSLWCMINGAESWNENPWVWVVEFERIGKPKDF